MQFSLNIFLKGKMEIFQSDWSFVDWGALHLWWKKSGVPSCRGALSFGMKSPQTPKALFDLTEVSWIVLKALNGGSRFCVSFLVLSYTAKPFDKLLFRDIAAPPLPLFNVINSSVTVLLEGGGDQKPHSHPFHLHHQRAQCYWEGAFPAVQVHLAFWSWEVLSLWSSQDCWR